MTIHGSVPAPLQDALERLRARRGPLPVVVRWFESLASTMDVVGQAADAGHPPGLAVLAEQQTAGRGRRGRAWSSPSGAGLYFSLLVRPARHIELVTLAAGVGLLQGIAAATGFRAELKWPNDVMVGARKLAGVLAEGRGIGTPDPAVIVGVGLNVRPAAYPLGVAARAAALETELGRPVERYDVFAAILEHLVDVFRLLDEGGADDILHAWRAAAPSANGTRVAWTESGTERQGITAGVDGSGALLVRTPAGVERIIAGELHWTLP